MISAVETYPGTTINIIRNLYIVHNTTNSFNITCSATPLGPYPILSIDRLTQNSMATFVPLYQEANSTIVASFPGGLTSQYTAVYTCISLDGYSTRVYLTTYQGMIIMHMTKKIKLASGVTYTPFKHLVLSASSSYYKAFVYFIVTTIYLTITT